MADKNLLSSGDFLASSSCVCIRVGFQKQFAEVFMPSVEANVPTGAKMKNLHPSAPEKSKWIAAT
jgi:hypothetical protein